MTLTVSLSPHHEEFIRQTITDGRYHSETDVIGSALRLLEEREHERAARQFAVLQGVRRGFASNSATPLTRQDWDNLKRSRNGADARGGQ